MSTLTLAEFQLRFKTLLKETPSTISRKTICAKLAPPVSFSKRLFIYRNAYWMRMTESLEEDFPSIKQLLGDHFESLVKDYLKAHPSTYSSLAEVSLEFPKFLDRSDLILKYPFLGDLARWDWCHVQSTFAPESRFKNLSKLSLKDYVTLSDSTKLCQSAYPIHNFPSLSKKSSRTKYYFVIFRTHNVQCLALSQQQWSILSLLQQPRRIADLSLEISQKRIDPRDISSWFSNWIENRIITIQKQRRSK